MEEHSYEWWNNFEKELREKGKMLCPVCENGTIEPYGNGVTSQTAKNFYCNNCDFRIIDN